MNFPANADGWIDVLDHVLVAVFMLLISVIPTWITVRNHRGIKDIKGQVVNGHSSPLREDLDRAISTIETLVKDVFTFRESMMREVAGLRHELLSEEERRRANVSDIRDEAERRFDEIYRHIDRVMRDSA